jgi:uncharacterized protein YecE (DUF72 family)
MIKIGCEYAPKVTSIPITEFPDHVQVAELGNTFYRFLAKNDITKMAKLPKKFSDFEFSVKLNRFITHKYQFRHGGMREEALETMEKMVAMANALKCNKILIQTHFTLEYDEVFFKNVRDFFNSITCNGMKFFWEIRGLSWCDKEIRPKLAEMFSELNIGHCIDLLFSKPLNVIEDGTVYTRLHGFGAKWNNYMHKLDDMLRLIKDINEILANSKEVYVIFPTVEKFNDAIFLKKLWEDIAGTDGKMETFTPSFRSDFLLKYSFSGQHMDITYQPPFAVKSEREKIKISTKVSKNMHGKIEDYVAVVNEAMNAKKLTRKLEKSYFGDLKKLGEYLLKYLLGKRVNYRYRLTKNNTLLIETDEKSLCYPYELILDGRDFVCLKNNVIRKVNVNGEMIATEVPTTFEKPPRILFLNRSKDEAAQMLLSNFSVGNANIVVLDKGGAEEVLEDLTSGYDIISYIGTVELGQGEPALRWGRSLFPISELIERFNRPPKLFAIGNVIQQKMQYDEEAFKLALPFIKSSSNFLTNFITLPRKELVEFLLEFYKALFGGIELPTALTNTRRRIFERYWGKNASWLCFTLFGDEKYRMDGGN